MGQSYTRHWFPRFVLMSILMTTGLLLSAQERPTAKEVSLEKKLIEAEKYTFLGDWEKAEPIFRSILEEDVQNSAVCYQLSRTLLAQGKTTDALSYIRKAIRIEPDNEWYLLMEADIHEKIGDVHSMMNMYTRLIKLKPGKPYYYEMMIGYCKKTEQPERLLSILDQYEKLVGINEPITRSRFETLDALGKTDEALAAIQRLTEVYPLHVEYKYLAASYAKKIGNENAALQYYRDILSIYPEDSRAKLALAGAEKKEGDPSVYLESILPIVSNPSIAVDVKLEELIPYVVEYSKSKSKAVGSSLENLVQHLMKAHPGDAKVYAIQGDIFSIGNKDDQAIAAYRQSVSIQDNVYAVWEQLISLLMAHHRYEEVLLLTDDAMHIFPNQSYLCYASGYAAYRKRQYDNALDMLTQALIMTGKNVGQKINVYNLLGLTYDAKGDIDRSTASFESALALNPKNAETQAYYALTLSKRILRSDRAVSMADRVVTDGHTSPLIHRVLAEVYFHQDQWDKALRSIDIAIQEPMDGEGYNLAGDIYQQQGRKDEAVRMWQMAIDAGYQDSDIRKKIAEHKSQ